MVVMVIFNDVYASRETAQTLNLVNYCMMGVIVELLRCNKHGDCVGFSWANAGLP